LRPFGIRPSAHHSGGLFQGEGDMFINEVPPDDYRSIRRAILRPEDMPGA
jgi:hypothetical protein